MPPAFGALRRSVRVTPLEELQMNRFRTILISSAMMALAACQGERTAEAETPVAEAEVSTELPETVVSDPALQATANAAAQIASTPPPVVVPVPVGSAAPPQMQTGNMAGTAPSTGNTQ
jgi:hypothetical protein